MNRRLSLLLIIMTPTFATVSFAGEDSWFCFSPYIGAEAQWRQIGFHKGYGDNLFKHDFPQGNVFLGVKANEYMGLELGYEITKKRQRINSLGPGDVANGGVLTSGVMQYNSTAQLYGPHVDLVGFLPIRKAPSPHSKIDLLASIGMAYLKGHFVSNVTFIDGERVSGDAVTRTFSGSRNILRLGVGLQNMLSCDVGIRFMINWENTAKLKLTNKEPTRSGAPLFVKPKNSVIYNLGLFVTW